MTLGDAIPKAFHEQFAAFVRLEPRCRSNDFARGLEARTADPLWMLARQWQTGEFLGEDAGSPLVVRLKHSTQSLDKIRLGDSAPVESIGTMPLEVFVERENFHLDWRTRVQIGQQFERLARDELGSAASSLIEEYRSSMYYALEPTTSEWENADRTTRRYIEFMKGRVIDGKELLRAQELPIPAEMTDTITRTQLDSVTAKLRQWWDRLYSQPDAGTPGAWRPQQLDYRFELNPLDGSKQIHRLVDELATIESQLGSDGLSPNNQAALEARAEEIQERLEVLREGRTRLQGELAQIEEQLKTGGSSDTDPADLESLANEKRDKLAMLAEPKTRLVAPDYRNGALDWYTFNVSAGVKEHEDAWISRQTITVHPTRISVAGASPRWWAFEDANVDFGNIDVAKPDLAKLLLMEFVLIYGDDWFSVPVPVQPVPVQMGNLVRLDELCVLNVFGETLPIQPARKLVREAIRKPDDDPDQLMLRKAGDPDHPMLRWELFTLSPQEYSRPSGNGKDDKDALDILLVPPVAGFREESAPTEEVRFLRDEGANMVWGVEHTVRNGLSRPVDGFDAQRERIERQNASEIAELEAKLADIEPKLTAADLGDEREEIEAEVQDLRDRLTRLRDGPQLATGDAPRYRLSTTVPENWFPFMPTNARVFFDPSYAEIEMHETSIRLRRAQMLRATDAQEPSPIPAMSRLLEALLWLEEATVPRSGLRVQLTAQRVRWVDGKTHVWLGRKATTGKGEGSSGLEFDHLSHYGSK